MYVDCYPENVLQTLNYLSLRQARIRDENAANRATVLSAIRYTFADPSQSYDELLAPLIIDFLSLMLDQDLVRCASIRIVSRLTVVRRLSGDWRYQH
jgi:hypothetical protein